MALSETGAPLFLHQLLQPVQDVPLDVFDMLRKNAFGARQIAVADMVEQFLMGRVGRVHGGGKQNVAAVFEVEPIKQKAQGLLLDLIAGKRGQGEVIFHVLEQSVMQIDFPGCFEVGIQGGFQSLDRRRVKAAHGLGEQSQLDLFPKFVNFLHFLGADGLGIIAAMTFMANESLKFKPFQRLDDRCLTHAQTFGQIPVGDFLSWRDFVVEKHLPNALIGLARVAGIRRR
ncbi:hypothetical protein DESC_720306 [Desulfosarcina cetonica]|nr:hypothetical protein DESC_720306 [Desulfosarcina cetonica]